MIAPMPVGALLYRLGFLDADLMIKMGVKVKGLTSAAIIFFVGGIRVFNMVNFLSL